MDIYIYSVITQNDSIHILIGYFTLTHPQSYERLQEPEVTEHRGGKIISSATNSCVSSYHHQGRNTDVTALDQSVSIPAYTSGQGTRMLKLIMASICNCVRIDCC